MSFNLTIPQTDENLDLTVNVGECLFILGANGSGKSSIMQQFYRTHRDKARRISAHRQSWFSSNESTMLPDQKRNTLVNLMNQDIQSDARYRDPHSAQRANLAIQELIDSEIDRARVISRAVENNDIELAKAISGNASPVNIINELLQLSNIPIKITVNDSRQIVASKSGSAQYSITELSDGERNAIMIAANVLTAEKGTLILIDEPERHLHRSIISPLLTLLFAKRPDCAFIISTHDVMLPLDNPTARTLLVRDCIYDGSVATSWDASLIPPEQEIDEDLKRDILGSRRKILFIEGTENSLDKPLYSLIFPNVTIIAKESCRDVMRAVYGIRAATTMLWLHAYGLIDNDRRSETDVDQLKANGIYALPVYSVESIYYHPDIQKRVLERHAIVTGENVQVRLESSKTIALAIIKTEQNIIRLTGKAIEKELREEVFRHLPKREDIVAAAPINISINVLDKIAEERQRLEGALENGDLHWVIAHYPVRETGALNRIASELGFQSRDQYEGTVRKLFMDDEDALAFARSLFGDLETDIN